MVAWCLFANKWAKLRMPAPTTRCASGEMIIDERSSAVADLPSDERPAGSTGLAETAGIAKNRIPE